MTDKEAKVREWCCAAQIHRGGKHHTDGCINCELDAGARALLAVLDEPTKMLERLGSIEREFRARQIAAAADALGLEKDG